MYATPKRRWHSNKEEAVLKIPQPHTITKHFRATNATSHSKVQRPVFIRQAAAASTTIAFRRQTTSRILHTQSDIPGKRASSVCVFQLHCSTRCTHRLQLRKHIPLIHVIHVVCIHFLLWIIVLDFYALSFIRESNEIMQYHDKKHFLDCMRFSVSIWCVLFT